MHYYSVHKTSIFIETESSHVTYIIYLDKGPSMLNNVLAACMQSDIPLYMINYVLNSLLPYQISVKMIKVYIVQQI